MSHVVGLRTVAILEIAKGLLVALIGLWLISLLHRGIDIAGIAHKILHVLHVDPVWHLSRVFLGAARRLKDMNLMAVAAVAEVYSAMRFLEGYGLWKGRVWAQWLALVSGMIYVPLELNEVLRRPTALRFAVLFVNLAVVVYMAYVRVQSKAERSQPACDGRSG